MFILLCVHYQNVAQLEHFPQKNQNYTTNIEHRGEKKCILFFTCRTTLVAHQQIYNKKLFYLQYDLASGI